MRKYEKKIALVVLSTAILVFVLSMILIFTFLYEVIYEKGYHDSETAQEIKYLRILKRYEEIETRYIKLEVEINKQLNKNK